MGGTWAYLYSVERIRVEVENKGERGDKWCFQIPQERAGDEEQRLAAGSRSRISWDKEIRMGTEAGKFVKENARKRVNSCPSTSSFSVKCWQGQLGMGRGQPKQQGDR